MLRFVTELDARLRPQQQSRRINTPEMAELEVVVVEVRGVVAEVVEVAQVAEHEVVAEVVAACGAVQSERLLRTHGREPVVLPHLVVVTLRSPPDSTH